MSELIVAVVPIRSLRGGKTRLASILSPDSRKSLMQETASRVVRAAADSRVVDTVLVVSPEQEVLQWATGLGRRVMPLRQPASRPGLNNAIDLAREWAIERDADGMLSLFGDLPLISAFDVRQMVTCHTPVVLGPDRRSEGTNALLLRLREQTTRFAFDFGGASLARHVAEARRLGLAATVLDLPGIGFDLDTPPDWDEYLQLQIFENEANPRLIAVPCGAMSG